MRRILFTNIFNHRYCDFQEKNTLKGEKQGNEETHVKIQCAHFVTLLFTGHFDKQSSVSLQTHKSSQMSGEDYGLSWNCVSKKAEKLKPVAVVFSCENLMSFIGI